MRSKLKKTVQHYFYISMVSLKNENYILSHNLQWRLISPFPQNNTKNRRIY